MHIINIMDTTSSYSRVLLLLVSSMRNSQLYIMHNIIKHNITRVVY